MIELVTPDFFAADREFIRGIADMRSRRGFQAEAAEFHTHSDNRSFSRRWLRVRVSAERARLWMEECWNSLGSTEAGSRAPVSGR